MRKRITVLLTLFSLFTMAFALSGCNHPLADKLAPSAKYIGDRQVQYDEATNSHTVFWAFYASQESEPMAQEADMSLSITNDNGELVYSNVIHVNEGNYAQWTNKISGTKFLGSITISDDEITGGSVSTGYLTLGATLPKGSSFEEGQCYIYNLPLKGVDIATPELPITISNYGFRGNLESTVTISEINYSYEFSCIAEIVVTMTYSEKGEGATDYVYVPYKIKDADGVLVDSGNFMIGPMSVGDTMRESSYFMNVELDGSYTIEFSDYTY